MRAMGIILAGGGAKQSRMENLPAEELSLQCLLQEAIGVLTFH